MKDSRYYQLLAAIWGAATLISTTPTTHYVTVALAVGYIVASMIAGHREKKVERAGKGHIA